MRARDGDAGGWLHAVPGQGVLRGSVPARDGTERCLCPSAHHPPALREHHQASRPRFGHVFGPILLTTGSIGCAHGVLRPAGCPQPSRAAQAPASSAPAASSISQVELKVHQ